MMNIYYKAKSLITNYMKSSIKFLSIDILWWKQNKFQKNIYEILEDNQREHKKEQERTRKNKKEQERTRKNKKEY
jgi:hypothetical protein